MILTNRAEIRERNVCYTLTARRGFWPVLRAARLEYTQGGGLPRSGICIESGNCTCLRHLVAVIGRVATSRGTGFPAAM